MKPKIILTIAIFLVAVMATACSHFDQRAGLTYEKTVNATGGSGELFIAKPIEKHNAVKKPSGMLILGAVKGTDRAVVTKDSIGDWVMLALMKELYIAGYNVKAVSELPENVSKGLRPS